MSSALNGPFHILKRPSPAPSRALPPGESVQSRTVKDAPSEREQSARFRSRPYLGGTLIRLPASRPPRLRRSLE
jgi:hypothetical protein